MTVKIYGRKTPDSKSELLREMEEIVIKETLATNAEQAMAYFAQTHHKTALFSDRTFPDIVYINHSLGA